MVEVVQRYVVTLTACMCAGLGAEPADIPKVLGSDSCSTSGCHGGAGPNRGAHTIWKNYDPHVSSAATLANGRSKAMAAQMGIENAAEARSCTVCHAPNHGVDPSLFASAAVRERELKSVGCANCHGGGEKWILSHTRPEYPRDALAKLGMRQLGTAYQRANNCVACHQNLSDELIAAKHPPLVFELDGMLVAEPRHWREDADFSNARTWLVGQAVALREAAAQAMREPGAQRDAEIEAIKELLRSAGAEWKGYGEDLVREADEYAQRVSATPVDDGQARAILGRLAANRKPFGEGAFASVDEGHRMWAAGCYAERLALALDRLNQALAKPGEKAPIGESALNALFNAAKPPKAFDATVLSNYVAKLDAISAALSGP